MKKIAFLLLCHKNEKQIINLLYQLKKLPCDIYIHIDTKSNLKKDKLKIANNIYILPDSFSFHVNWGGNSIIRATLALIKYVKVKGKEYEYFWLISGQDFPIACKQDIIKKLNGKNNFINIIDDADPRYQRYKKLYEIWYPNWMVRNNIMIKIIKRIYMIITGGYYHSFSIFKRNFPLKFYFGSQWWTLTSKSAYWILNYSNQHPNILKYFDHAIIPDECFIQTIFMASPYKKNKENNLCFVNWKGDRRSPSVLKKDDFDLLIKESKKFCFARKFDMNEDEKIIKKLKARLNKNNG